MLMLLTAAQILMMPMTALMLLGAVGGGEIYDGGDDVHKLQQSAEKV